MTRRRRWFAGIALVVLLFVVVAWVVIFHERGQELRDRAELLFARSVVATGIEWRWAQQVVTIDMLTKQMKELEEVKAVYEAKRRIQDRRERDLVWLHAEHGED